jgi:hypothetical protein
VLRRQELTSIVDWTLVWSGCDVSGVSIGPSGALEVDDQAAQHFDDFGVPRRELLAFGRADVSAFFGELDLRSQFAGAAFRVVEILREVPVGLLLETFGNV